MKILIAIESSDNAKTLLKNTLAWAPRAGYNLRIFVPEPQINDYLAVIEDANYQHYLDLPYSVIEVEKDPRAFAEQEGFDLILFLPDNLSRWHKYDEIDETVYAYATAIAQSRQEFSLKPTKKRKVFSNGAVMERVKKSPAPPPSPLLHSGRGVEGKGRG